VGGGEGEKLGLRRARLVLQGAEPPGQACGEPCSIGPLMPILYKQPWQKGYTNIFIQKWGNKNHYN